MHTELKEQLRRFWDTEELYWQTLASDDPSTLKNRQKAAAFIPEGGAVLDIACGNCANAREIERRCQYFGIDLSFTLLRRALQPSLRLVCGDADYLPFRDGTFEAVIATYVLEHAVDPVQMLAEIRRVALSGGRIILLGPGWDFPFWYPNALQSKAQNWRWRLAYALQRFRGQLEGLCFGRLPFYGIDHPDALDQRFVCDGDTVYVVWTYEVIRQMERCGCSLIHWEVDDRLLGRNPAVRWFKRILMLLPAYRYAGSTVLLVFER